MNSTRTLPLSSFRHSWRFTLNLLLALACLGSTCIACSVPVFRYALENWEPDRLTVAILHRGPMTADQVALRTELENAAEADAAANLELHPIDVAIDHPDGSPEAYYAEKWKDKELPQMLVFFSNNAPEPQLAWAAEFNRDNVANLIDSPARQQVVERLLDGQSAVWVLLKTGNKQADERAEAELKRELAKKPDEIELPSLTDLAEEEKFDEDLEVEMRVDFSVISIDPDDPQEAFFREMLLNTESDLKDFDDPVAVPIYGRGRTYFALVGPGITADNIADNCNFICGACSCEVKRDNPGQDLLLAANWNRVQPGNWVNDTPLPELTGIGGFEALAEVDAEPKPSDDETSTTTLTSVAQGGTALDPNAAGSDTLSGSANTADPILASVASQSNSSDEATTVPANIREVEISDTGAVAPMVLVWGAILFGIGLVFTVWQRSRNEE